MQPECETAWLKLTCSHSLAHTYFSESITNENNRTCNFPSYPWNGTFADAVKIMSKRVKNQFCHDCPEMGINAYKSRRRGTFLVITARKEPYCSEYNLNRETHLIL